MPNIETPELRKEAPPEVDRPLQRAARPQGGAPPGTNKRRPMYILTLVLLVAGAVGLTAWFLTRNYENTDDAFIDGHIINASSRISAQVEAVRFRDNDEVKKGQLLLELDPRDYNVQLEKAQAQLLQAQALVQQARAQEEQAQAQVAQQSAQSDIANVDFNRNASLYQKDFRAVSKQDLDTTRANAEAARGTVDAAKAAVEAAHSQVGSSEAAVHVAQAAVDDAELQLSYTRITAADDGRITHKQVEAGNYVTAGQTLFSIVRHNVFVTANFKETQLGRMKPGQPVRIKVDAFPGRTFRGHVDSFQLGSGSRFGVLPAENATGNFVKVVQRIPVKIMFDEAPETIVLLAPGMSVEPRVDVAAAGNQGNQ